MGTYQRWHHLNIAVGSGVMDTRDVQGGVRYDRGVVVPPPHGILTKKMFVPPMVSRWNVASPSKGREGWFI